MNKVRVKLPNQEDRSALFTAVKSNRPRDLFVNDYLIPSRDKLLYEIRTKKQELGIHSVFSFRGQIYIKKSGDSEKILVRSINEITK